MRYIDYLLKQTPCLRDRNAGNAIVALLAGMSEEDIKSCLERNPSYYRSTIEQ